MSDDDIAVSHKQLLDPHPIVSVAPGSDRLQLYTADEWTKTYNRLIPLGHQLISRHGRWTFIDATDVVVHGLNRFLTMENPEIRPSRSCFWHFSFHVKYGYLDVMKVQQIENSRFQHDDPENGESFAAPESIASVGVAPETPVEYLEHLDYIKNLKKLVADINNSNGRKEHMSAVLEALLQEDVGTQSNYISNQKIAKSVGLTVEQVVAAKRRLQRLGASK